MSLNPTQFPVQMTMFEPAGKLAAMPQIDTVLTGRSSADIHAEKIAESNSPQYADSIRESEARLSDPRGLGHQPTYVPTMDDSPTLADSIARGGIRRPVAIGFDNTINDEPTHTFTSVADGQHRVAVQSGLDPRAEVPVTWREFREPPEDVKMWGWSDRINSHPGLEEAASHARRLQ